MDDIDELIEEDAQDALIVDGISDVGAQDADIA